MVQVVYVNEYQPSSAKVTMGRGARTVRTSESNPLIALLAVLGFAYLMSKS